MVMCGLMCGICLKSFEKRVFVSSLGQTEASVHAASASAGAAGWPGLVSTQITSAKLAPKAMKLALLFLCCSTVVADSRVLGLRSSRLVADVIAAGGWKHYALRGHKAMLVLRELGHRGRATIGPRTPTIVARLFAAAPSSGAVDARRRTRRARAREISRVPLPAPLFFNVLQFWLGTPFFPWVVR